MSSQTQYEARIIELEIRVTEQESQIDELSKLVTEHWQQLEKLQKKLDTLTERFLVLEEQTAPDVPVTRPPHW